MSFDDLIEHCSTFTSSCSDSKRTLGCLRWRFLKNVRIPNGWSPTPTILLGLSATETPPKVSNYIHSILILINLMTVISQASCVDFGSSGSGVVREAIPYKVNVAGDNHPPEIR